MTMQFRQPLVSVVMPVYNARPYLSTAIDSILAQTHRALELIIVDDGSTDGSLDVVEDYARRDTRIRVLCVAHGGYAIALNAGIAAAEGDYIADLDADDIAVPERLEIQVEWMRRNGVDICGACVQSFGVRDQVLWFPQGHAAIRSELMFRVALLPSVVIGRAEILKENPQIPGLLSNDYELWTRLALICRLGNVQRILGRYRQHEGQTSRIAAPAFRKEMHLYRRRYFAALYPDASEQDLLALERTAEHDPHPDTRSLELAGHWLVRLARDADDSDQGPVRRGGHSHEFSSSKGSAERDVFLRERMVRRWLDTCRQSAHLGSGCLRVYRRIDDELRGPDADPCGQARRERILRLQCAARLRSGSPLVTFLRRLGGRASGRQAPEVDSACA
ncbi:MAG: glycosyltransferase family 2 protein [Capsulimonadaceae bacterium]